MPIIQCPNCSKKLKLKSVSAGKKVRCPGCQEAFQPKAGGPGRKKASRPKPKKRAPVDDDFVDFDDGDMYEDDGFQDEYDEPAQKPRRAPKGGGRKSAGKKKKPKGAPEKKSKAPMFIVIGLVTVAVISGVTFALMSGDDPAEGDAVADSQGADGDAADNTGGETSGSEAAGDGSTSGDTSTASTGSSTPTGTQTGAPTSNGTTASSGGQSGSVPGVNMQWLPANSELIASINVKKLVDGPLGTILIQLGPQIQQMKDSLGFGPEDIESITLGIGGLSDAIDKLLEPNPNNVPATVVFRGTSSVDLTQLKATIPNAEDVSEGGINYIRVPDDKAMGAIWLADSTTVVVGAESWVKQVAQSGAGTPSIDPTLFDGRSAISVAFAPSKPDVIFRSQKPPEQIPDPSGQMLIDFVKVVQPTVSGVGIGLDIGTDIVLTGAIKSDSVQASKATATALQTLVDKTLAMQGQMGNAGGQMAMAAQSGKAFLESFKWQSMNQTTSFSFTAPQGGQQLQAVAPMMVPMMMQSVAAGQQAAQRAVGQNNLKQVAVALHNFHSAYSRFPNAAPQSPTGEKWLSWRVHLLPFLGQQALYDQFALEEPWDSPQNRPLVDLIPSFYQSEGVESGKTLLQVPIGPGTLFEDGKGRGLREITDGSSNTIAFVQVSPDRAVYWTQPEDYAFDPANPTDGLGTEPGQFTAALADGSVKNIDTSFDAEVVKGLFTRNGGEAVSMEVFVPAGPPAGGFGPPPGFGPPGGFPGQ